MRENTVSGRRGGLVRAVAALVPFLARLLVAPGAFGAALRAIGPYLRPAVPAILVGLYLFVPDALHAGSTSPWEDGVEVVCKAFFGPIGKGLAIVAVVVGGLMFAFGEGGSKSAIAGLVFGAGMVLGAAQFLEWLGIVGTNIGGGKALDC